MASSNEIVSKQDCNDICDQYGLYPQAFDPDIYDMKSYPTAEEINTSCLRVKLTSAGNAGILTTDAYANNELVAYKDIGTYYYCIEKVPQVWLANAPCIIEFVNVNGIILQTLSIRPPSAALSSSFYTQVPLNFKSFLTSLKTNYGAEIRIYNGNATASPGEKSNAGSVTTTNYVAGITLGSVSVYSGTRCTLSDGRSFFRWYTADSNGQNMLTGIINYNKMQITMT